jgi:hypothetical protein
LGGIHFLDADDSNKYIFENPGMIFIPAIVVGGGYSLLTSCSLAIYIERYGVCGVPKWVKAGLTVGGILYVVALFTLFGKNIAYVSFVMKSVIIGPVAFFALCHYLIKRLRRQAE